MSLNPLRTLLALVIVAASASAFAGPLPTDPNALPGWQGTTSFLGSAAGFNLKVDVQYAVYAPGAFGSSAALGFPAAADPSGGTEYVYVYEAFNLPTSTALFQGLSVNLVPGAVPPGSTKIGNTATTPEGGIIPNSSAFIGATPNNAKWGFTTNTVPAGSHSDILLFTSVHGPQFRISSIQGGHTTIASAQLPSPVPEPSSIALSIVGALGLLVARFGRRLKS